MSDQNPRQDPTTGDQIASGRDPETLTADEVRQGKVILDTPKKRRGFLVYAAVLVIVLAVAFYLAVPG